MLQDKLDAFELDFETNQAPPVAVALFHKATAELIASGQAKRALKLGDQAPVFDLPNADGVLVNLNSLLVKGPVVLTFYRGAWCSYCNLDLQAIESTAAASIPAFSHPRQTVRSSGARLPLVLQASVFARRAAEP